MTVPLILILWAEVFVYLLFARTEKIDALMDTLIPRRLHTFLNRTWGAIKGAIETVIRKAVR